MTPAALDQREQERLDALQQSGLLDSASEEIFDEWTLLASKLLKTPVVLLSLVDKDRQFFKSQVGLPPEWAAKRETPLSHSFCQYVAASQEPLVVSDARQMPLVRENKAIADLGVIAYAGMPLTTPGGQTLGSFCAIDSRPREWTAEELETLRMIGEQAMAQINLRLELVAQNAQLDQSRAQNRERDERLHRTVHDLRTPLTSVMVGLEAIQMGGNLGEKQRRFWEIAMTNARALRDLVTEILSSDKPRHIRNACRPQDIVAGALELVAPLAERAGVHLETSEVSSGLVLQADEKALVRVVTNLLSNAIKFTPRGRRIWVRVADSGDSPAVVFSVQDEGIGVAAEDHEAIFQQGETLGRMAGGNGIGLAYCKATVEEHGGTITIKSGIGAGSTFSFSIPCPG